MQFLSTSTTTKTYRRHYHQHQHQNQQHQRQQQPHHCHQQQKQQQQKQHFFSFKPNRASLQCLTFLHALGPLLLLLLLLDPVAAGSCREAQLCCSGRDSSCVVQKAPINAIIEDLSDKPCYCDHACLKLGDCCDDFKDHCGVLDCQVSDWGQWSECDKSCGTGMMSRARKVLQAAQNGGKHCPSLVQKRGCQGFRCHGHHDKRILREMALLLPAALSRNRHANDSSDIRRNLRVRYRDSYRHNREHEYCVEFEVIKASKTCHKLPPYNQMLEGDRITVRCDLEALIQDSTNTNNNNPNINNINKNSGNTPAVAGKYKPTTTTARAAAGNLNNNRKTEITNNSAISEDNDDEDDDDNEANDDDDEVAKNADDDDDAQDEENMLDGSDENYEFERASPTTTTTSTTTTTTTTTTPAPALPAAALSYHCRGEGLPGRTTRWSALAAPSCRGKWLRLTVGPPKKCTHSQFIFV